MKIRLDRQVGKFVPEHLRAGLVLLKNAREYALDLGTDVWEFAVELDTLKDAGLDKNDLRWLAGRRYVETGRETTHQGSRLRQFQLEDATEFCDQTCVVLTQLGTELCDRYVTSGNGDRDPHTSLRGVNGHSVTGESSPRRPTWDSDRHELRIGTYLVKQYKLNSPNQESILAAFEEEGWPPRIHDPLSPRPEAEPKERLRNTIKSLNRKQVNRLIRFMGDGTGQAVRWELTHESQDLLRSV